MCLGIGKSPTLFYGVGIDKEGLFSKRKHKYYKTEKKKTEILRL